MTASRKRKPRPNPKRKPRPNPKQFLAFRMDPPCTGAHVPGYLLPSELNERGNRGVRIRHTAAQRDLGSRMIAAAVGDGWATVPPMTVTLTRTGACLLDSDNLVGAFKAIRDGIAKTLGCGDGPEGPITWRYEQRKGAPSITCEVSP